MTVAWYAHLKHHNDKPWWIAALASWGVALFENGVSVQANVSEAKVKPRSGGRSQYMLQVPANRIGYVQFTLPQLKILQEVITLAVFAPFAIFYMQEPLKWDYLWAALCLVGAVYFIFRS